MSRRPALTVQADIARAIRAAQACGAGPVGMVEIKPDGTIRIVLSPVSKLEAQQTAIEPVGKVVL